MIWATDSSAATVFVSSELTTLMGVDFDALVGDRWMRLVHEDDKAKVGAVLGAATKEQKPFTLRYRLLLADGVFYWVSIGAIPSFGPPDHTFLGFLGSLATLCPETSQSPIRAYGKVGEFAPSQAQQRQAMVGLDQLIADALLVARSFAETLDRGQVKHAIDLALFLIASRLGALGANEGVDRLQ